MLFHGFEPLVGINKNQNTVKPLYVEHVDNWFLKIYLLK
jgi:hypothetical protein